MSKISIKEKASYGFGDVACNTIFTVISSYLMFFYTDVAGLGLAAIGSIMLISRIVDAVTDPIMGRIVDRTHSKWGKCRPYILWMAVPFAVISVAMFFSPSSGKFAYALITYVLFCVAYTALNIPYTTLLSNVTDNVGERLSFNMFKTIGSNVGGFIATGLTLALVGLLGKGNQQTGFLGTMILYGVVAVILLFVCFKNTRERITPIQEKISLSVSVKAAVTNKSWILVCIIAFLNFTGLIVRNQGAMYYAKYYLNQETIAATLMSIPTLLAIPLALVTPKIAQKIGKKNCVLYGNLLLMVSFIGVFFAQTNLPMVYVSTALGSLGSGISMGVSFVMGAETVDYSEWKTGVRPQGLMTAWIGFMVKMGMAVAGVVSTAVLSYGGYVENVAQTAKSLSAIKMNYIWVPFIIAGICVIISLFYNLDKEYPKVIKELQERRKVKNQENN